MTISQKLNYNDLSVKYSKETTVELADSFTRACYLFDFELIKFFLKFPKLREINGVYGVENYVYKWACIGNRVEIIDYVLTSKELKQHADANFQDNFWLTNAIKEKAYDVIHYFVFDLKIDMTDDILKKLVDIPDEKIQSWLKLRELNNGLSLDLPINDHKDKPKKI